MRGAVILVLALSVLAVAARADDVDPEPPGGNVHLRKLRGKWVVESYFPKVGKPMPIVGSYEFVGDKVTIDNGTKQYVAKVKVSSKNDLVTLRLTPVGLKTSTVHAFKIEKGKLYLAPAQPWKAKQTAEDVFRGKNGPVKILARAKE
jgi:hypothetical protein